MSKGIETPLSAALALTLVQTVSSRTASRNSCPCQEGLKASTRIILPVVVLSGS